MYYKNLVLCLLCIISLCSCATYSSRSAKIRQDFFSGNTEAAIGALQNEVNKKGNDQLLYLMDLGIVYFATGNYSSAIQTFLKASEMAERTDYVSISEETGRILLNDEIKPYKGENFEKILIHVYLALSFTLSNQWDSALVECRKINHKLELLSRKNPIQKIFEYNIFAKYLAAALFEARQEWNHAFVDYRQLDKWGRGKVPYLAPPLLRMADKLKATQEYQEYKKKYPHTQRYQLNKNSAEIILILEYGQAPVKEPSLHFRLVPVFIRSNYREPKVILRDRLNQFHATLETIFDVEDTAIRELDDALAGIIAKKAAGFAIKEAAAYGVGQATDNKTLGVLTSLLLHATDTADLRSWTTLPARFQIARLIVPAGKIDLVLDEVEGKRTIKKGIKEWKNLTLKPNQHLFLNYRILE